jgi:hypothetical protein
MAATLFVIKEIRTEGLTLGIVAPPAGERTAFKKYSGADSRTIMCGKSHDVEDTGSPHDFNQSDLVICNL